MNSKFFFGILLLAAGILVGWYMVGTGDSVQRITRNTDIRKSVSPKPTNYPKVTENTSVTGQPMEKGGMVARSVVTYTETGFSPSPLTIEKGETVTFVNESDKQMQVASAVYPTHQILPAFVQTNSVGKGGIYEYTFVTIGTWKYQNDIAPIDTGVIIVK